MDDLELITFVELKLSPTVAGSNLAVSPLTWIFMSLGLRLNFAQTEFARGAASGVCGLHEDGRIWKARFVHINAHLGVAAGVG